MFLATAFLAVVGTLLPVQLLIELAAGEQPTLAELFLQLPTEDHLRTFERNLESGNWLARLSAWGETMMYGKKVIGVIRSTVLVGETGRVIRHWKRVPKAADHPTKILEYLQEL